MYNVEDLLFSSYKDTKEYKDLLIFLSNKENYNTDNKCYYVFGNRVYEFTLLSSRNDLSDVDKFFLNGDDKSIFLSRVLKNFGSLDLKCSYLCLIKDKLDFFNCIIEYKENNIVKVMDFYNNIIMNKDDYYKLFGVYEYNKLDKNDLYIINFLVNELDNYEDLLKYLLFDKEILKDLKKNYKELNNNYTLIGKNKGWLSFSGNHADDLFFMPEDYLSVHNFDIINTLDAVTESKYLDGKRIKFVNGHYEIDDKDGITYKFKLISDYVLDEDVKKDLLSNNRFGNCHVNAPRLAYSLFNEYENIYVVGGKVKSTDKDYYFHSWVEVDTGKQILVFDYNHNIIMEKSNYYKLFEAVPVEITNLNDYNETVNLINENDIVGIHYMDINYFGKEIRKDLERVVKQTKK